MAWEFYIYNNMIVKQLSLNSKKSQYKRRKYIRIPIFHSIDHIHHLIYNSFSDQWGVTDFVLQVPFICTYAVYTIWTHILIVQSRNKRGLTEKKTSVFYNFAIKKGDQDMIFTINLRSICSNWLKRIFG